MQVIVVFYTHDPELLVTTTLHVLYSYDVAATINLLIGSTAQHFD